MSRAANKEEFSMLADPVTIAANTPTPALVFRVVKSDGYGSERRDDAGAWSVVTTHETTKGGTRHYVKMTEVKDATSPYTGTTSKQSSSVSLAVNVSAFGWTADQQRALVQALIDYISDSEVTIPRILAFQS